MTFSVPQLSVTFYLYGGYRLLSSSWIYQISINVKTFTKNRNDRKLK